MAEYISVSSTRNISGVSNYFEYTCPVCGKQFYATSKHAYKKHGTSDYVCSYTCMLQSKPKLQIGNNKVYDTCKKCYWLNKQNKCGVWQNGYTKSKCNYFTEKN